MRLPKTLTDCEQPQPDVDRGGILIAPRRTLTACVGASSPRAANGLCVCFHLGQKGAHSFHIGTELLAPDVVPGPGDVNDL